MPCAHAQNKIKKKKKKQLDINITQMIVGKQWVKSWYMYRWTGEASTQVKEARSSKGDEAEGNAFY